MLWASSALARPEAIPRDPVPATTAAALQVIGLPLEEVAAPVRDKVRQVILQPTLAAHAPLETFSCHPEMYFWLLENQDRASIAWRRMGAKCVEISDRGNGRFGWTDGQGSDVTWNEVYRGKELRIWFAEGVVRAGLLLPHVPVRAVVVLRHAEGRDQRDRPVISHQISLYVHADSKAAALAKRLFGTSIPRLGEQYVQQMELFFSSLAGHLQKHPDQIEPLLTDTIRLTPGARPE